MKNIIGKILSQFLTTTRQVVRKFQSNRKLRLAANLVILIAFALFIGIYISKQWSDLQNSHIQFDFKYFALALLIYGLNIILFIVAWNIIVKVFKSKLSFLRNAQIYSITMMSRILPTPAWYLFGRVYYYREEMPKRIALIATLSETILHVWIGFLIYCLISLEINHPISFVYGLAAIVVTTLLVFVVHHYLKTKPVEFSLQSFIPSLTLIILIFAITWIFSSIFFTFIIQSLTSEIQISIIELWKIWIISSIISYISSYTLGGLGLLREVSLIFFISSFFSPPLCVAIAILSRLCTTIGNIIWPGLFLIGSRFFLSHRLLNEKSNIKV